MLGLGVADGVRPLLTPAQRLRLVTPHDVTHHQGSGVHLPGPGVVAGQAGVE